MKAIKIICVVLAIALISGSIGFYYFYDNGLSGLHSYTEAKEGQIRVSCVGDSVTYGHSIKNWKDNNYPAVLQGLLGEDYCVQNFGESGATVQDSGDQPYTTYKPYTESQKYLGDIVVIMIGSNDSKPENWKGEDDFKAAYRTFLGLYLTHCEKIYICTPPATYYAEGEKEEGLMSYDIQGEVVSELTQYIREVAEEFSLPVIEISELTANHREWFSKDGVHPNNEGAKQIANAVCEAIKQ